MADGSAPSPAWLAPFERWLRPWLRDIRRAAVTGDALLTLDDVCELVPGREGDVRTWALANVRALNGPCGALYRWRDVQEAQVSGSCQRQLPDESSTPALGVVYLIAARKAYKIGYTAGDPYARLRALQTGCPDTLALLASFPGSPADERALHERWASLHHRGEWFTAHAAIVSDFLALARVRGGAAKGGA